MAKAQEYRKFAEECLRWADEAETEEFKDAFIQMARDWTLAAMRLEAVAAPPPPASRQIRRTAPGIVTPL
jgi:hypothetical protein